MPSGQIPGQPARLRATSAERVGSGSGDRESHRTNSRLGTKRLQGVMPARGGDDALDLLAAKGLRQDVVAAAIQNLGPKMFIGSSGGDNQLGGRAMRRRFSSTFLQSQFRTLQLVMTTWTATRLRNCSAFFRPWASNKRHPASRKTSCIRSRPSSYSPTSSAQIDRSSGFFVTAQVPSETNLGSSEIAKFRLS